MATSWLTTITLGSPPATRYRVELHADGAVRPLGVVVGVPAHHTSLEPFVTELLLNGERGQLVLIDDVTGAVVARRRVRAYGTKPRDRFRQAGDWNSAAE